MRPEGFAGGDAAADGSGWEIDGVLFETNPRRLLTPGDDEMVRIWAWTHTGGMGARPLPDAGGYQDQIAIMMDALDIMDRQEARMKKVGT